MGNYTRKHKLLVFITFVFTVLSQQVYAQSGSFWQHIHAYRGRGRYLCRSTTSSPGVAPSMPGSLAPSGNPPSGCTASWVPTAPGSTRAIPLLWMATSAPTIPVRSPSPSVTTINTAPLRFRLPHSRLRLRPLTTASIPVWPPPATSWAEPTAFCPAEVSLFPPPPKPRMSAQSTTLNTGTSTAPRPRASPSPGMPTLPSPRW